LLLCCVQVQMPPGATPQHGGRLTAQDVISSDLITFSSMQVGGWVAAARAIDNM
jgi:hypothetical protein